MCELMKLSSNELTLYLSLTFKAILALCLERIIYMYIQQSSCWLIVTELSYAKQESFRIRIRIRIVYW